MNRSIVSKKILPPTSGYSHALEVSAGSRIVYLSGQIPVAADGSVATTFDEQAQQCWANMKAVLEEAGLSIANLVKTQGFVTSVVNLPRYRAIRNSMVQDPKPASTLMVVAALGRPEWLCEIEAVAAGE